MQKIILLLLILCLCGCAVQEIPAAAEPVAEPVVQEPKPVPAPILTPYMDAMADGKPLTQGAVSIEGTPYVDLPELLTAIGAEFTDPCNFQWKYNSVFAVPGLRQVVLKEQGRTHFLSAPVIEAYGTVYVPLELCSLLGMSLLENDGQLYITSENGDLPIPEGYHVPTLMYHAVSDNMWGFTELFVSPSDLEAQLQYLTENGFTTIHFSDLAYVDRIEKPVLLTFDDGYLDNYTELFPILQKYNCKATIFVITGSIGTHPHYMTWEQAREMADSGLVSIQSHTVTHPELDNRTKAEQLFEMDQSKLDILQNIGREPYVFSYPTGRYNWDTITLMEGRYNFGLKMVGNDYITGQSPLEVNRWYVPRGLDFGNFMDMVQ